MIQTRYSRTEFSKACRYTLPNIPRIPLPSLVSIEPIIQLAFEGDHISAMEVFKCFRFCKSPETPDEVIVMNKIVAAFRVLFI